MARCSASPPAASTTMSAELADVPFKESSVVNFAPGNGRIVITKPGMNHPLFETKCMFKLRSQDGALHTYQLVAYLGDGVTGQIYLAHHFESKTRVAVKVFTKKSRSGLEDKELTLLRSLTISDLQHENLIKIHHYSAADSKSKRRLWLLGHGTCRQR